MGGAKGRELKVLTGICKGFVADSPVPFASSLDFSRGLETGRWS
jgi:hypothetical protein